MNTNAAVRLTAALASLLLSLLLFQGVASLGQEDHAAAPQQMAAATTGSQS